MKKIITVKDLEEELAKHDADDEVVVHVEGELAKDGLFSVVEIDPEPPGRTVCLVIKPSEETI